MKIASAGKMASAGILDHHPSKRLAVLETEQIANHFKSESSWMRNTLDQLMAKIENRFIERVLVNRMRAGLKTQDSEVEAVSVMA